MILFYSYLEYFFRNRKFLRNISECEGSVKYFKGSILPIPETGSSQLNQRILEYKLVDCPLPDFESVAVKRIGKFVIACLNARQNGTLIMGK